MAESRESQRRRLSVPGWIGAILAVVLLVAGVVWGVLSNMPADGSGPGAAPTVTTTPQPTDFETPTPGATTPVTKPGESVEVPLDKPSAPVEGAVVEVAGLKSLTAGRDIPGESSGPAVEVTVRITNKGDKAMDTAGSNVTLTYGGDERLPAVALTGDQTTVWPTSIAAGASADAVFLFSVPLAPEGDIRVIVDLLASAPDVVFVGPRP